MKVYTYCSFDGSKVGFHLGTFQPDSSCKSDYYIPKKEKINEKVRKAFESGIVKKIYGKLSRNEPYIVMIKGLKSNGDLKKYGNFAFEFDNDFNNYSNYRNYLDTHTLDEISEKMNQFLIPDNTEKDYGIKISAKKFKEFIDEVSQSSYSVKDLGEKEFFYIETKYLNSDYTIKLNEIFGRNDIFRTEVKNIYSTKPKKTQTNNNYGAAVAVIVILFIIKILLKK